MMIRHLVALTAIGLTFAVIACGGGSSGSVTYAPTVVPIKHIDFTGVELSAATVMHPPQALLDQYPAVVAAVNGQPVTNAALAYAEFAIELNRRQVQERDTLNLLTPSNIHFGDPLEDAIDNELRRQAIVRLSLLPSREVAVTETQKGEASFDKYLAQASSEARATAIANNHLSGYPDRNWASVDKIVDSYRWVGGDTKLLHEFCDMLHTPVAQTPGEYKSSGTCSEFLARERKNAKIVYYVRWAD